MSTSTFVSTQKQRGRKNVRRDRSVAHKTIALLREQLEKEKRQSKKYKKQAERVRKGYTEKMTPKGKTTSIPGHVKVSSEVTKALLFGNVLTNSI